jgi:hypothetical protein
MLKELKRKREWSKEGKKEKVTRQKEKKKLRTLFFPFLVSFIVCNQLVAACAGDDFGDGLCLSLFRLSMQLQETEQQYDIQTIHVQGSLCWLLLP